MSAKAMDAFRFLKPQGNPLRELSDDEASRELTERGGTSAMP